MRRIGQDGEVRTPSQADGDVGPCLFVPLPIPARGTGLVSNQATTCWNIGVAGGVIVAMNSPLPLAGVPSMCRRPDRSRRQHGREGRHWTATACVGMGVFRLHQAIGHVNARRPPQPGRLAGVKRHPILIKIVREQPQIVLPLADVRRLEPDGFDIGQIVAVVGEEFPGVVRQRS